MNRFPVRGASPDELPRLRSGSGLWIMAATVLGSGLVSLDATVVTLADRGSERIWAWEWTACNGYWAAICCRWPR